MSYRPDRLRSGFTAGLKEKWALSCSPSEPQTISCSDMCCSFFLRDEEWEGAFSGSPGICFRVMAEPLSTSDFPGWCPSADGTHRLVPWWHVWGWGWNFTFLTAGRAVLSTHCSFWKPPSVPARGSCWRRAENGVCVPHGMLKPKNGWILSSSKPRILISSRASSFYGVLSCRLSGSAVLFHPKLWGCSSSSQVDNISTQITSFILNIRGGGEMWEQLYVLYYFVLYV